MVSNEVLQYNILQKDIEKNGYFLVIKQSHIFPWWTKKGCLFFKLNPCLAFHFIVELT